MKLYLKFFLIKNPEICIKAGEIDVVEIENEDSLLYQHMDNVKYIDSQHIMSLLH